MRIAHVCPFVGEQLGGSERYVSILSPTQSKSADIHIYTTTRSKERAGIEEVDGITFHRFHSPVVLWNINPLSLMMRSLAKSECDILHIHSYIYFTSNQAAFARAVSRKKALLQLHGGVGPIPYRTSILKRTAKRIYDHSLGLATVRASNLVASVSHQDLMLAAKFFRVSRDRLRYVPNAVDTNRFRPRSRVNDKGKSIVLCVGDLETWKGVESLLGWISDESLWDGQEITFQFVGQGSFLSKLLDVRNLLRNGNSGVSIEILGERSHDDIPYLMNDSSALVLPSFWEGMPTVVLEAMASGVPVIATPVGDLPHIIQNGVNGLLIERNAQSFQAAIRTIVEERAAVENIKKNAREMVEKRFSIGIVAKILEAMYLEILERDPSS